MSRIVFILLVFFTMSIAKAQSSSDIIEQFERLASFKTVLYMAAHPDDENTRVIAWLVNGEHAKTAYLSLTRGDGGQNLIGDEFGDALGILRTQELLAARNIDGGEQFFTRAVDFGYSRSAEETLAKWDEEQVLGDVVWVIRTFRPAVIITRFPPDSRGGHGHHTASAMLAIKGAEAASDPSRFPEQLDNVQPWQVQSVYWNASSWWDKTLPEREPINDSIWKANIGGYNANMGMSFNELGSLARSQHKCQGFGVAIDRGEKFEYFQHLWGELLPDGLLRASQTSWDALGRKKVGSMVVALQSEFIPTDPAKSIPALLAIYKELAKIKDAYWRTRKQAECAELIQMCGGFFAEALADEYAYPGNRANVTVNLLARASDQFAIDGFEAPGGGMTFKTASPLPMNKTITYTFMVQLPDEPGNPYWLSEKHSPENAHKDMYKVSNLDDLGRAMNRPLVSVKVNLLIDDVALPLEIPVRYKWRDRVEGEQQRDVITVPAFTLNFEQPMYVFLNGQSVDVKAKLKWFVDSGSYPLEFKAPGWNIEWLNADASGPGKTDLTAKGTGLEEYLTIRLTPVNGTKQGVLEAVSEGALVRSYQEIAYPHIPTQVYMPQASARLTHLTVSKKGKRVAYIQGAGDRVADGIAQMGYEVDVLSEKDIANTDLSAYQAVVLGIRAYNTQAWLQNYTATFFRYIKNGGNFIVQYNTASRFLGDKPLIPSPYEFDLGRGRVTEENAKTYFLLPDHPVLNQPNRITTADFENWVQERGLYFASSWNNSFLAPLGWADTGRELEKGGLIIADYGEGAFIYTGISFFRELPKGVPGAYRLLANLISYEAEID
jgi:LmbE family N-acetylglucosaminyl deacetylase